MNFIPHTNNSLFIGDLSKFCTEQNLEELFAPYGEITEVKIKRNISTGKTLSYGFVTFADDECAAIAMQELDGCLYCGRNLRIRWAVHNVKEQKVEEQIINSVYVRFITPKLHEFITEEDFHKVFDVFGCVEDVSIKESSIDKRTNRQSGYGFVHFSCNNAGIASAFQAVSAVDNATFDGVLYNVELSKNLLKQFNELKGSKAANQPNTSVPTHHRKNNHQMNMSRSTPNNSMNYNNANSNKHDSYHNSDLQSIASNHSGGASVYRSNNAGVLGDQSKYIPQPQQKHQQQYDHMQQSRYSGIMMNGGRSGSGGSSRGSSVTTGVDRIGYAAAPSSLNDHNFYHNGGNDYLDIPPYENNSSNIIAVSKQPPFHYPANSVARQQQHHIPLSQAGGNTIAGHGSHSNTRPSVSSTAFGSSKTNADNFYQQAATHTGGGGSLMNHSHHHHREQTLTSTTGSMIDGFQGLHLSSNNNTGHQSLNSHSTNTGFKPNPSAPDYSPREQLFLSNSALAASNHHQSTMDIFKKSQSSHSDQYITVGRNDSQHSLFNGSIRSDNTSSAHTDFTTNSSVFSGSAGYFGSSSDFSETNLDFIPHELKNNNMLTTNEHPLSIRTQWQSRDLPVHRSKFDGNELDVILESESSKKSIPTLSPHNMNDIDMIASKRTNYDISISDPPTSLSPQSLLHKQADSSYTMKSNHYSSLTVESVSDESNNLLVGTISNSTIAKDLSNNNNNMGYDNNNAFSSKNHFEKVGDGINKNNLSSSLDHQEGEYMNKPTVTVVNKSKQLSLTKFFVPISKKN